MDIIMTGIKVPGIFSCFLRALSRAHRHIFCAIQNIKKNIG